MSNLQRALKRAEQDRAAAKQARAQGEPGSGSLTASSSKTSTGAAPSPDSREVETDVVRPAVMRSQRDAVRPSERIAPPVAVARATGNTYRGVAFSLLLAIVFAVGLGLSLRGRDADKLAVVPATSGKNAPPLPTTIPAALVMSGAGPMQLRLDRSVDAVGKVAHRRNQLQ